MAKTVIYIFKETEYNKEINIVINLLQVILYRGDNKVDFQHRDSNDYALGFGNKHTDFWQGNNGSPLLIMKTHPSNIQIFFSFFLFIFFFFFFFFLAVSLEMFCTYLIFAQNIDCGYTLEPPHRGDSNEYPKSMFLIKNRKNRYTPANPSFAI